MEDLRKLESQLSSMQLRDVDKELLEKLLGGDPKQDFEGVMRMQSLLEEGGYVLEQGERFDLTPKGVRRVGHLALRDIYRQLRRDGMGRHTTRNRGSQEMILETSRPYVQGDPFHINMIQTLKNGLLRGGGVPVRISPSDFAVYESEYNTRAATVLLLDMSWSMSWEGRFAAAKKSHWRWRVWCVRFIRAIISASSVSLPAPLSSRRKICRRQPGTWAIPLPIYRMACIWRPKCSATNPAPTSK